MKDKIYHFIARHLPKRLVYWSAITLIAKASTTKYRNKCLPDLIAMDAVECWFD